MDVAFLICSILLFGFGIVIGSAVGEAAGARAETAAAYWKMNAVAVAVAVIAVAVLSALPLLYSLVIGLLAGAIVGMKMSFGESVGPWRVHDRIFNVNRSHREAAARGTGAARRRARRTGGIPADLISVEEKDHQTQAPGAGKDMR